MALFCNFFSNLCYYCYSYVMFWIWQYISTWYIDMHLSGQISLAIHPFVYSRSMYQKKLGHKQLQCKLVFGWALRNGYRHRPVGFMALRETVYFVEYCIVLLAILWPCIVEFVREEVIAILGIVFVAFFNQVSLEVLFLSFSQQFNAAFMHLAAEVVWHLLMR